MEHEKQGHVAFLGEENVSFTALTPDDIPTLTTKILAC